MATDSLTSDRHPHLHRNLKSLTVIGMCPIAIETKSEIVNTLRYYYGYVVFGLGTLFLITEYIELYFVWGDLQKMTTNASESMLAAIAVFKMLALLRNKSKLRDIVLQISNVETSIIKYSNRATKNILNGYIKRGKEATYFFWAVTFFTIIGFLILPTIEYIFAEPVAVILANGSVVFKKERPFVFSSYFPFDKHVTPFYEIAIVIQIIGGAIGSSALAIWDTFIVAIIIYAIGQLQILQYTIRTVSSIRERKICNEAEIYNDLVECIRRHKQIIKLVEELDSIISPVMFLYFGVCSIMLCAIGFQASLYGASLRVAFLVEYLIAMLVQLLLFYWHGNEVILESSDLTAALWDSGWYDRPRPFCSTVHIMMVRASRPLSFNIGRFYTMNLETFLSIINTSYSYFALLRQLYSRP